MITLTQAAVAIEETRSQFDKLADKAFDLLIAGNKTSQYWERLLDEHILDTINRQSSKVKFTIGVPSCGSFGMVFEDQEELGLIYRDYHKIPRVSDEGEQLNHILLLRWFKHYSELSGLTIKTHSTKDFFNDLFVKIDVTIDLPKPA